MNLININARDLPDAWFQCIWELVDKGRIFKIDRGSYMGQYRHEFDYITIDIKYPGSKPLLPDIPAHLNIPNPVSDEYLDEYVPYIMTSEKKEGEDYTYGERLTKCLVPKNIPIEDDIWDNCVFFEGEEFYLNQIQFIIETYKKYGYRNNQMVLQIARPSDILLGDPPCLREIDTRIQDNKLHFFPRFRSWDLWCGFPANLAGIQLLKEYMAAEIGIDDGKIIASSKGLHVYGYAMELAKIRTSKVD